MSTAREIEEVRQADIHRWHAADTTRWLGFIGLNVFTYRRTTQRSRGGARLNGGRWTQAQRLARHEQMRDLFARGYCPFRVAKLMGVSYDSVRRYCREHQSIEIS